MICLEDVELRYADGPAVLSEISCRFPEGSFHFLTGVSGAGKSSLLRLLHLGLRPTKGKIEIFGKDAVSQDRDTLAIMRQKIGVVFQDFRLIDHLNVYDNVALPLRVSGKKVQRLNMRRHSGEKKIIDLLNWVGLGQQMDQLPPVLSGGQKQRVAIARAIINRPQILLADEPTGNVDDKMGLKLIRLFEELNKLGTTIIVATHSQLLLETFQYPTLTLCAGRLTDLTHPTE